MRWIPTIVALLLYSGVSAAPNDQSRSRIDLAGFEYIDQTLEIRLTPTRAERVKVTIRPLNDIGRRTGRVKKRTVEVTPTDPQIPLDVGLISAHGIDLSVGKREYRILASRGLWYLSPNARQRPFPGPFKPDVVHQNDVVLAPRFVASGKIADTHQFEVGRTLGRQGTHGIPVTPKEAIVVTGASTLGPVTVTLTQRIDKQKVEYFDYPLMMNKERQRYVLPLFRFVPRRDDQQRLKTIYAVSLRSQRPAREEDVIEIELLAKTKHYLAVADASIKGAGMRFKLINRQLAGRATVSIRNDKGHTRVVNLKRNGVVPAILEQESAYYLCLDNESNNRSCDPPDAPWTSYRVPRQRDRPFIIDSFTSGLPVNSAREPTQTFTSAPSITDAFRGEHTSKSLRLVFTRPADPKQPITYGGYRTPLPANLPIENSSFEVTLRGNANTRLVMVGLRDAKQRETKVHLDHYLPLLGDEWQTVRIPTEAFRALLPSKKDRAAKLGQPRALTITVDADPAQLPYVVELAQLSFIPQSSPLSIAQFEAPREYLLTAMGGVIRTEKRGAAAIDLSPAPGIAGSGLSVKVTDLNRQDYALISLGLGHTDASAYDSLTFWVQTPSAPGSIRLFMNDGKNRSRVELTDYLKPSVQWQRVVIPLSHFSRIRLNNLLNLLIVWEETTVRSQTVLFDDFKFDRTKPK